jgi:hypothetical protein
MKRDEPDAYSDSEQATLRSLLEVSPCVHKVKTFEKHRKGGYAVTLDIEGEQRGQLADYLSSHGLMLVL